MRGIVVFEPDAVSILNIFFSTIWILYIRFAVLFVIFPVAHLFPLVLVSYGAHALFFILDELSLEHASIGPVELAPTVHFVLLPLSFILSVVCPLVKP